MKGALPWLVCFARTRYFCSALAALVGQVQNIFGAHFTLFKLLHPQRQQAGKAAVLGHLSLSMCLWLFTY
jgi:hypothetical protein